jgi:hypothetical protein
MEVLTGTNHHEKVPFRATFGQKAVREDILLSGLITQRSLVQIPPPPPQWPWLRKLLGQGFSMTRGHGVPQGRSLQPDDLAGLLMSPESDATRPTVLAGDSPPRRSSAVAWTACRPAVAHF